MRRELHHFVPAEGGCDCPHHRPALAKRDEQSSARTWFALVPAALCLFCPACFSVWAPLLGILGWGVRISEGAHGLLLLASVGLSLLLVGARARRRHYWLPFGVTAFGGGVLVLSHPVGESLVIAACGCLALLLGALLERRPLPRTEAP